MKAWLNREVKLITEQEIEGLIPFPPDLSVCVVPKIDILYPDLVDLCDQYNTKFPEYIFLDSHPDETLTLRGKKTVWEYPAMLIQRRDELLEARGTLSKMGFYKNWDKDLLDSLGIQDSP